MRSHLSDERMMELLEGGGSADESEHLTACARCRARLEEARSGLTLASRADVPEPPGLYWEAFRSSVRRRIAEERRPSWWWRWLAPLAATAAALVVAWSVFVPGETTGPTAPTLPAWSALPPAEDDEGAAVLSGLAVAVGDLTAWEEGEGLGDLLSGLSDEESETLVEALRVGRQEAEL